MPKVPFWVFIVIAVLYFTATRVDIMDIDASQYAEISREMMKSGDYLHVFDRGLNYLDKPPFLFWVSAASMKVFGVNNFGYRFPSLLFALLAIFATYQLAKLLYEEKTARMAALVLACCQGMMLWTNDVRCDGILTAWVITAIWLLKEWFVKCRWPYLIGGFAAVAFGMMTKGPIAMMVPVFAFSCEWALKREWRNFFRPGYLIGFLVIAILLVPMCMGLYQQFDLHPETVVNGQKGTSGLRFFFWSQSFGRITGENPWKNDVDMSFLLQNMLWSYLPWIFLFLPALAINVYRLVKQKFRLLPGQEWISTGGFLVSYLALGSSSYQLPHYIFVAFPLAAIVTARLIYELVEEGKYAGLYKVMQPLQTVVGLLILLVTFVLIVYVFPAPAFYIVAWVAGFIFWMWLAFKRSLQGKMLWLSAASMVIANIFLTNQVYYTLLQYQVGSQVGKYVRAYNIPSSDLTAYKFQDALIALHFYAGEVVGLTDTITNIGDRHYVLAMAPGLEELHKNGYSFDTLKQGRFYKVSELTPDFLNPRTRDKAVKTYYFVKLK
jgi:4-amino-4-deoxy-L-arabinose transferase-like glycosyltransferase